MITTDRTALICDLAETYHVYDIESLPLRTTAALAAGLRENSRIKMKIQGTKIRGDVPFLLAMTIDRITDVLTWFGAYKENPMPESIVDLLIGYEKSASGFETAESFEKARAEFMGQ